MTKSLIVGNVLVGFTDDEVVSFEKDNLKYPKTILGKIKNPLNMTASPDLKRLICFSTTGTLYQIPLFNNGQHKKLKISKKPNSGQVYFCDNNNLISVDWAGNINWVNLEENKTELISSEKDTMFYALFPSIKKECFLVQGLTGDTNTFIRKYTIDGKELKIVDEVYFGDRVLAEINLCLKKGELLYFIDCQEKIFGLYSYNENTGEIKKHFALAKWDDLWKILACYKSLNYSEEYKCFLIVRSDKIQLFDIDGNCIKEFCIQNGYLNNGYSNAPYDAYILNDKLYINTIIGVYEETLDLV